MKKKKKIMPDNFFMAAEIIIYFIAILFLSYRVQKGIDFTDEAWYVAEPYLVARGDVFPYISNWTQAPGFTIPLAIAYKLYITFFGTEGIFLFSRFLYIAWMSLIGAVSIWLVHKNIDGQIPHLWFLPLMLAMPCLFDVNYNTIGLLYLPLVLVLVFSGWRKEKREAFLYGFLAGLIGARAIIGTLYILPSCILILILTLFKKKWSAALGVLAGTFLSAAIVVVLCCAEAGLSGFYHGLYVWIHENGYLKTPLRHTWSEDITQLVGFLIPSFLFSGTAFIFRLVFLKKDKFFSLVLAGLTVAFFAVGISRSTEAVKMPTELIKWCWFESFSLLLLRKRRDLATIPVATLMFFLTFLASSFGNIYGFGSREYWLVPGIVMSCLSFFVLLQEKKWAKIAVSFVLVCIFCLEGSASIAFSYRDDSFDLLQTRVPSGVWKGCITTEQRAKDIVELEAVIRERTRDDDHVFFQDWVSFGYLMSNGNSCAHSSLRGSGYTYGVDDPAVNYIFFQQTAIVPTKIIYIDYGRDVMLSIEDPNWKFNEFVLNNYKYTNSFQNTTFRMLEYDLSDKESAIKFISEHY